MTTRAIQIDLLLAGLVNPTSGEAVSSGTVYFYEAGTTTGKSVWTEKEKTNAYTSYSLNGIGAAQLYGEGNYKIVVKDSDGATVQTLDNIRLEYPYYGIRTITTGTVSMLSQDDYLLCNTSGGAITINALDASLWLRPLKIQRISGSNTITIDPNGSQTIDGAADLTISSDAIVEIISDGSNLRTAGYRSATVSADGDTSISVDDDLITIAVGGADIGTIDADGLTIDEVDAGELKINGTKVDATAEEIDSVCYGIGVSITRKKTIYIGDWDMDTSATVNVVLTGLSVAQIQGIRVMIINDAGTQKFPLPSYDSSGAVQAWWRDIQNPGSIIITLYRLTGGDFDSTDFDSTSYNRGYIIADYIDP
jgi:hypothetical protein